MSAMNQLLRKATTIALLSCLAGCSNQSQDQFQGYVEGEFVYVASPLAGQLEILSVQRGQQVTTGQPLFALDRFAFSDHVVTKNFPASVIGSEQSAKHSQERGLAAAVWPEKAEDLAGADCKIDVIYRGEFAEPLRHSPHLDHVFPVFHFDLNSTSTG